MAERADAGQSRLSVEGNHFVMLTSIPRIASIVAVASSAGLVQLPAQAQEAEDTPHGAWIAEDIGGKGVVDRVRTTLELRADGSAGGSGGCNRFRGTFEFTRDTIRFGAIAGTMMACPPAVMDQEQRFYKALENARGWKKEQGKLLLLDGAGTAVARLAGEMRSTALTIDVPGVHKVERRKLTYDCGGKPVDVEYLNAGGASLATLSLQGEFVVAASVMAASGARYAGERLVWWTKGDRADLYDLTRGEDAAPVACEVAGETPAKH